MNVLVLWGSLLSNILRLFYLATLGLLFFASCGSQKGQTRSVISDSSSDAKAKSSTEQKALLNKLNFNMDQVKLTQDANEQVINGMAVAFSNKGGDVTALGLTGDSASNFTVDMEQKVQVDATVAPDKYLRVTGQLIIPQSAGNHPYETGCLFVELRDNVYYREKTWLRVATTGISGQTYSDVSVPIDINYNGWKNLPKLADSLTLQNFSGSTIKKFSGTVCFKLDFSNAPAQEYVGAVVFQYLRENTASNSPTCNANDIASANCAPNPNLPPPPNPVQPFQCKTDAVALKANQTAEISWNQSLNQVRTFDVKALGSIIPSQLGSIDLSAVSRNVVIYNAPASVSANAEIAVTAYLKNIDSAPVFCKIKLIANDEFGIPDDGQTLGIKGNVYKLAVNQASLPDFSKMTPVDHIVASNIDVPNHAWSAGFPGVRDLFEWFGIQFRGNLYLPSAQVCMLRLKADDGANLYLDGFKVIDNDGLHPAQSVENSYNFAAGNHTIRVDYYQGPRYFIALQLEWKCGAAAGYQIIPPEAFREPLH